jgi:hypothetical protein
VIISNVIIDMSQKYLKSYFYFCVSENQDTSFYIKTVSFLLMYMFERKQVFSKTDVANYAAQTSERMYVVDNHIFFWTNHQKMLIDFKPKRVLFTSDFGTGKTTLLKAKAMQLGKESHMQHLKSNSKPIDSSKGKINQCNNLFLI